MRFITRRQIIKTLKNRWLNAHRYMDDSFKLAFDVTVGQAETILGHEISDYKGSPKGRPYKWGVTAGDVRKALNRLDFETAARKEIDTILFDSNWTSLCCDECGADVESLISLQEDDEIRICKSCLEKALKLIKKGE
jgi:hypothetical protein